MSHHSQLLFMDVVRRHFAATIEGQRILEVGSYDVNGSIRQTILTARPSEYCGVDLVQGPNVDLVCSGDQLAFPDDTFGMTISSECFEHNSRWRETLLNMVRMTRPGGAIVVTCATRGRLEHGTRRSNPQSSPGTQALYDDYYQNLTKSDFESVPFQAQLSDWLFDGNKWSSDLYFVGIKGSGNVPENLRKEVRSLRRILPRQGVLETIAVYFPLRVLAALLPDRQFQDAALAYLHGLRRLKRAVSPASAR